MKVYSTVSLLVIFIHLITGCANVEKEREHTDVEEEWEHTKSINTFEGYKTFIMRQMRHGDSKYECEAWWGLARCEDSVKGYEIFLEQYPTSDYACDASWEIARHIDSAGSYGKFMRKYPDSEKYHEAKRRFIERAVPLIEGFVQLAKGMSIEEVEELIGPLDVDPEKLKEAKTMGGLANSLVLSNAQADVRATLAGDLYWLEFRNGKLHEWNKTSMFPKLQAIAELGGQED